MLGWSFRHVGSKSGVMFPRKSLHREVFTVFSGLEKGIWSPANQGLNETLANRQDAAQ